jgi:signal transduction histidine kinase
MIYINKNNGGQEYFSRFQIIYIIFLACCIPAFLLLIPYKKMLIVLLIIEYFMVFYYPYVEYHIFMEFIWSPGTIAAAALLMQKKKGMLFTAAAGIAGPVFLSYGYIYNIDITIGALMFPFYVPALVFYIPVTLLAILGSHAYYQIEVINTRRSALELENAGLNEINHAISQRLFSLQNDTTQKERNRLTKEIHDTAGYVFINLIMMLQAVMAILRRDIDKADKLLHDARDYADRGINEIRHLLRNIRNYTPVRLSLQNELYDVGESFRKATDVEIEIEYSTWPKTLPENLDSFFISFMQESLTNALKHGHADRVSVHCWDSDTAIGMTITDNGSGAITPIKKGIGITAMEEVISQLDGSLTVVSDEQGFRITAAVPKSALNESAG